MDLAARLQGETLHANAVALDVGCGALIVGQSGSGKSALSLKLMSMGAQLVSDDQVHLRTTGATLVATAPASLRGRIEARGIGILNVPHIAECHVGIVVDLDRVEPKRLPDAKFATFHDVAIPLILAVQHDYFASAIFQRLQSQGQQ